MLLAIDIGNTHIVVGLYDGPKLINHWRLLTVAERTADEYGVVLTQLLASKGFHCHHVRSIIAACVVPPMASMLQQLTGSVFGLEPLMVGPGTKTGMPILYDSPKDVGADRIVNGVAAYEKYHSASIVVDFGTATTVDFISKKGEYVGGAIAPGLLVSLDALILRASKLPRIEIIKPSEIVGRNTVQSIQAGVFFGYVGLVDGIVRRMQSEYRGDTKVVATGGLASLVAPECSSIDEVDEFLTLDGLRIIHGRNTLHDIKVRAQ